MKDGSSKAAIGLIGLAVMGQNLARNSARFNRTVVFNRTVEKTDDFIKEYGQDGSSPEASQLLTGATTPEEFVTALETPRKIILMVKAGDPVDAVISQLVPLLEKDDIIIDGGNSHYTDTARRQKELAEHGLNLIGMGVSGGEEGALNGPSMMPGGDAEAYKQIEPLLKPMAADDGAGGKCFAYVGRTCAGHFVKMVHNGIEYAIMQAMAESYDVLRKLAQFTPEQLAETFTKWNKNPNLNSYLTEITAKIFAKKDDEAPQSNTYLIDKIKDRAKQKGTGKWTTFAAMDYGITSSIINAAVDARISSGHPKRGAIMLPLSANPLPIPKPEEIATLAENALELTTILAYFQGFDIIAIGSQEYSFNLEIPEIARIWRGGCIIRSGLLPQFQDLYSPTLASKQSPNKSNAKLNMLKEFDGQKQANWRALASLAISHGIPVPATQAALSYYDSLRANPDGTPNPLPQNLTQAQRDFFGAHTYARTDREGTFHTEW